MSATVELRGVARRFAGGGGLQPTTLALTPGATTVLLGPSGCGKSTLLRLVNGLLRPDAGEVVVFGTPVRDDTAPALRRRMGYVIQDGGLFPHLTGLGNVALLPTWLGWDEARIRSRARELCELARLPVELLERYPHQVSGGQAQRFAIALVLALGAQVVIADEPTSALDVSVQGAVLELIASLQRRLGLTVLFISHDLGVVNAIADDVAVMRAGRILEAAPRDAFFAAPRTDYARELLAAVPRLPAAPADPPA